jgi:hypothetical protein
VPSRLLPFRDVLFLNSLEADLIPSRRASFRPVDGHLGSKLGPANPRFSGAIGNGRGPPFQDGVISNWQTGDIFDRAPTNYVGGGHDARYGITAKRRARANGIRN